MPSSEKSKRKLLENGLKDMNSKQLLDCLIESLIEPKCIGNPSFIMNHPIMMSPLAKSHAQGQFPNDRVSANLISERFELFVNKMEIINSYSEQNDEKL